MSATKILWGQILCVLAIVLVTTWGATQWTAWRLVRSRRLAGLLSPVHLLVVVFL